MRSGDSRNCCTVRLLDPSKVTPERGREGLTSDWLMSVRKAMLLWPWAPEKTNHFLVFPTKFVSAQVCFLYKSWDFELSEISRK